MIARLFAVLVWLILQDIESLPKIKDFFIGDDIYTAIPSKPVQQGRCNKMLRPFLLVPADSEHQYINARLMPYKHTTMLRNASDLAWME